MSRAAILVRLLIVVDILRIHGFNVMRWDAVGGNCLPGQRKAQDQRQLVLQMMNAQSEGERRGGITRSFNLLETSSSYSDRIPQRLNLTIPPSPSKPQSYIEEWGLSRECPQEFPSTVDEVVDAAFLAIAGTLCQSQRMDPNVASNAMSKSIFTQRPVRNKSDCGRIGLEIDGVEHLFTGPHRLTPASGIRRIALLLAAKLSNEESWMPFEQAKQKKSSKCRPVTLCFNTIKQALVASNDLKQLEWEHANGPGRNGGVSPFENIRIQCIQDGVPKEMRLNPLGRRRNNGLADGYVAASNGFLLVVQPTDYNLEHKPPGPAVDAIGNFQRLVAQASIEELPIIVLSPRFLSNESPYGGWDQSGYQQSATYGGIEPPRGPTPWIMRDFTPPVFCWIGDALKLNKPPPSARFDDCQDYYCYLSRMAMSHSVMDSGHPWNLFVAKECTMHHNEKRSTEYLYLGSTRSAAGRPTRAILKKILEDC